MESQVPALLETTSSMTVGRRSRKVEITASLQSRIIQSISTDSPVNTLCIEEMTNLPLR